MEDRIRKFIEQHHVLNLATASGNTPWAASCFYAWMEKEQAFVFSSESDTKHIRDLEEGEGVAGTVVLETSVVGKIRGIQFTGRLIRAEGDWKKPAKKRYLKRFPYAATMKPELWVLQVDYIKMTDNRLGFGKKLIWKREEKASS